MLPRPPTLRHYPWVLLLILAIALGVREYFVAVDDRRVQHAWFAAQQAAERASAEANRAAEQVSTTLAGFVHDLAPAVSAFWSVAMAQETCDPLQAAELRRELRHLDYLFTQVRQYHQARHLPVARQPVPLVALLLELAATAQRQADDAGRGVVVRVVLDDVPAPAVLGDDNALVRVLTNLLRNALHAAPDASVVTLTTLSDDDWVRICVTDRGPGIPDDQRDAIFAPHVTTGSGLGLGLAIVSAQMQAMGGHYGVERTPDAETMFWIALPPASLERTA